MNENVALSKRHTCDCHLGGRVARRRPASASREIAEAELLRLARLNCPDAVAALWLFHYRSLCRAAARVTDRFDAEDLAAEAFANLLQALRAGRGPTTAAGPYLRAIVRHLSIRWTRRAETTYADSEMELLPDMTDRFAIIDDAEELGAVAGAFKMLPERWRHVLWLTDVDGLTTTEVGQILGLEPNAVSQLRWRAINGLRKLHDRQVQSGVLAAA